MNASTVCHLQVSDAVRLRREAWGGVAFDRAGGDLLDLDREGFAVLAALRSAQTLPALQRSLRRLGHPAPARVGGLPPPPGAARFHPARGCRCITLAARPLDRGGSRRRGTRPPRPLVAHWAVTYRCNLHCPFCYSESGPGRPLGPDRQTRRLLVERLAAWGVLEVALGGGEPAVLPDFVDLLAAIRSAGMVPNVTTNGTVSSGAVVQALVEHAGVVHLSADRPDLLDAARGEGVFARLRQTAAVLRQAGVPLGVNLLLTPDNIRDVRRSLTALLDLGVQAVTFLRPKGAWGSGTLAGLSQRGRPGTPGGRFAILSGGKAAPAVVRGHGPARRVGRGRVAGGPRTGGARLRRRPAARGRHPGGRRLSLLAPAPSGVPPGQPVDGRPRGDLVEGSGTGGPAALPGRMPGSGVSLPGRPGPRRGR